MTEILIDNEYGVLKYQIVSEKVFIHLQVRKWSKELFFEYLKEWHLIKQWFKDKGYSELFTAITKDDKIRKFDEMFGFEVVYEDDFGYLMRQEI